MTFLQSVSAASDYLVSKVVGEVEAGACVGSVHQVCCIQGDCGVFTLEKRLFSCFGACNVGTNHCC